MEVTSYRPETASVITYVSKWKKRIPYIIAYGVLGLTTLPIILMYLWLLLSSFSKQMKYGFIPVHFTLENWKFYG